MQVKTKSGFKCDINDKILDDWRFTRAVAKTHADDDVERMNAAVDLVSLILRDNEEAYYKYVEKKNGGIFASRWSSSERLASAEKFFSSSMRYAG